MHRGCGCVAMGHWEMREGMARLVEQRCASCWAGSMASLGCHQYLGGQGWVYQRPLHSHCTDTDTLCLQPAWSSKQDHQNQDLQDPAHIHSPR